MSPTIFRDSSTRSTTLVVSTQRWAISARSSSRISIPGLWSNQPPDSCPPQGAHSTGRAHFRATYTPSRVARLAIERHGDLIEALLVERERAARLDET